MGLEGAAVELEQGMSRMRIFPELLERQRCPEERQKWEAAVLEDPTDPDSLVFLAMALQPQEEVQLTDGGLWSKKSLYARAIELSPRWALPCNNLAATMRPLETVTLELPEEDGGQLMLTREELVAAAIGLDPSCAEYYNNLACMLRGTLSAGSNNSGGGSGTGSTCGVLKMSDGSVADVRMLLRKALELDPRHAYALTNLAVALQPQESTMWCGADCDQVELLLQAILSDSSVPHAYVALALNLQPHDRSDSILMKNGEEWDREKLLLRAIELEPSIPLAFEALAEMLDRREDVVRMPDGSTASRRDLLVRASSLSRWQTKAEDRLTRDRWHSGGGPWNRRTAGTAGEMPLPVPCCLTQWLKKRCAAARQE
mmetsp:Transcript_43376/g.102147  ORF Transcript_43376/g.102147 Transcript_43376/m.102147 type:complete len:372 (-) Transcript_43376:123-1238(-)